MAACARYLSMLASQFEGSHIMVKGRGLPTAGGMAGGAVGAQQRRMRIALTVTGSAVGGSSLENPIGMAV